MTHDGDTAATLETPAPQTGELFAHDFHPTSGLALAPERVEIDGMPKHYRAAIELARHADRGWFFGFSSEGPAVGVGSCHYHANFFLLGEPGQGVPERQTAYLAALKGLAQWFAGKRKAKAALAHVEGMLNALAEATGGPAIAPAPDAPSTTEAAPVPRDGLVPVAAIEPSPHQTRQEFDAVKLGELADTIRAQGLLQPIAVREIDRDLAGTPRYQLILGERRWRAVKLLEWAEIPARIYTGLTDVQAEVMTLTENLQREQLNAIEEAEGFARFADLGLTQKAIGERVKKSRAVVANALRLLDLPAKTVTAIRAGKLTAAHGIALARFSRWPLVVTALTELVLRDKTPAGEIETGVPWSYELCEAGLAVRIRPWNEFGESGRIPKALKEHEDYMQDSGELICFNPPHWAEYKAKADQAKQESEAREQAKKESELAAAQGKGKQLDLELIDYKSFVELDAANVKWLKALVPDSKRATAGRGKEKCLICVDPGFIKRLQSGAGRVLKADRAEKLPGIETQAREKIAKLKKVGPRQWAWVLACLASVPSSSRETWDDIEAAARQGVSVKAAKGGADWYQTAGLETLAEADPVEIVRVLLDAQLVVACAEIQEQGADRDAGDYVRWILEVDELDLLEETPEGKKEILKRIEAQPWYARAIAGKDEDEAEGAAGAEADSDSE